MKLPSTSFVAPGMRLGNLEWIAARSLRNCHCPGVDSILFNDKPEQRVRVFVAQENHQLWRNQFPFQHKMAVGLHPHHCNVELRPIFGEIWNVVRRPGGAPVRLDCFSYLSPIAQNEGHPATPKRGQFKRVYSGAHFCLMMDQIAGAQVKAVPVRNGSLDERAASEFPPLLVNTAMPAQAIHTIYVPRGQRAAWFVYEGREDKEYQALCWSNDDLEKFDFATINHPMTVAYLETLLASIPELGAKAVRV